MSYSKVCDGCENHCNLDPGEKPCKDTEAKRESSQKKSAVRRESKSADQSRKKSLALIVGQKGGKVNGNLYG